MQPAWRFEKTEFRDRSGITDSYTLHSKLVLFCFFQSVAESTVLQSTIKM